MWFEAANLLDNPGPYPLYWGAGFCLFLATCFLAVREIRVRQSPSDDRTVGQSETWFILATLLCLLAFRFPSFLYLTELNVDESQLISNARKFLDHPVPWLGVDTTTSGPLNSYVLALPAVIDRSLIGYSSIRLTGAVLLGATLALTYLTLRPFCGEGLARLAVLPSLAMLGMHQRHFLDYSTELFPITLIASSLYLVARFWCGWLSVPGAFIAGLMLGAAPFAKLQAGPMAVLIFGIAVVVLEARRRYPISTLHNKTLHNQASGWQFQLALALGGVTVPVVIVGMVLASGAWQDAWRSYILTPLFIGSRELNLDEFLEFLLRDKLFLRYVLFSLTAGAVPTLFAMFFLRTASRRTNEFWLWATLAYGLTAMFCIWKGANPWDHYLLFLVHPLALLMGLLWGRAMGIVKSEHDWRPSRTAAFVAAVTLLLLAMLFMRSWGRIEGKLARSWYASGDVVASLIRKVASKDRAMAVWGWMPEYYVKTGLNPATRDILTQFQIQKNPLKTYYIDRYLRDFRNAPPNIVVVATGPGNFNFYWDADPMIEAVPELGKIVRDDFVLAFDLQNCATPETKIYISKARQAELSRETIAGFGKPMCLK